MGPVGGQSLQLVQMVLKVVLSENLNNSFPDKSDINSHNKSSMFYKQNGSWNLQCMDSDNGLCNTPVPCVVWRDLDIQS